VSSLQAFGHAAETFARHLGDVRPEPLGIAIALVWANLLLRTRAWYNILRAAYPGVRYRWRSCAGAYLAGVGVNAIAPARGGDLVKLYLVRTRLPGSTTPTILSTLIVETLFDSFMGIFLLAYAYYLGVVPQLPDLPSLPAFEFSFAVRHPRVTLAILAVLLLALLIAIRRATHAVRDFWARVRQGFAILRRPRQYLLHVVLLQALGWCCRFVSVLFFLKAFGIPASAQNALVVLVVMAVSTLLPFTPGGVGTQQALIVVVLSAQASRTALLSFSVGMQVAMMVANIAIGALALALMVRTLSIRKAIHNARAAAAAETAPRPPP
jgi:uncharacterized membrane protein YbhN (UPF0104 family)